MKLVPNMESGLDSTLDEDPPNQTLWIDEDIWPGPIDENQLVTGAFTISSGDFRPTTLPEPGEHFIKDGKCIGIVISKPDFNIDFDGNTTYSMDIDTNHKCRRSL